MWGFPRKLGGGVRVELIFVASRGPGLRRVVDATPPQPALVAKVDAFCRAQGNSAAILACEQTLQLQNLYFGLESGVPAYGATGTDAVKKNAFFHTDSFAGVAPSIYHALQANITNRLRH